MRLTDSITFLLYSDDNVFGSMGLTTGFPFMGQLSICLYCFIICATSFYPNFLIPAFADICVNMAFVATFINESISYFDYLSLINILFLTYRSYHQTTSLNGICLIQCSLFLACIVRFSKLHRLLLLETSQSRHLNPV